jgi:hypothetical protein
VDSFVGTGVWGATVDPGFAVQDGCRRNYGTFEAVPLGAGTRLFDGLGTEAIELEQTEVTYAPGVMPFGFVSRGNTITTGRPAGLLRSE